MSRVAVTAVLLVLAIVNLVAFVDEPGFIDYAALAFTGGAALSVCRRAWRARSRPQALAEYIDVFDWCEGCGELIPRQAMDWLTPELYRCDRCRGVPVVHRLAALREVANGPKVAAAPQHVPVVRAAFMSPFETASSQMIREVMTAAAFPPAMVAVRVTELRDTGPVVMPPGVRFGTIERPDGTVVPIISSG
ncbi:hypothetical protein [Mycolicibacterium mageritense]|uniref:hypothetical protein n=1 Tax=Mycolicibacterium mageritense TaxID=53462 RepID=UPI001E3DB0F2|nr:hypothetical protein [Mycolicibacterium mageritense]GJJ23712.1 hypothetical protein MTY414_73850 [Mycolicibacterium mageritense]